jgi:serine protease
MKSTLYVALLLSLLTVSGCGGGGGGGGGAAPVTPPANQLPIADAGADLTVNELSTISLDGSGSRDPDGTLVEYRWSQSEGPPVELDDPGAISPLFTAPDVNDATTLVFTLTVTDAEGASDSDSVTVTVVPAAEPARFSLAGTITAAEGVAVDGDVNDVLAAYAPNDTLDTAQPLPNPVTLGGYLNEPGSGEAGRSQAAGDTEDYYRVNLLAGQTVTLIVADFATADADLYLLDTANNIVDFSIDTDEIESLVVPVDGTYLVNPSIFTGATNYILVIGSAPIVASRSRAQLVPGEVIVRYASPDRAGGGAGAAHALAERMGLDVDAGNLLRTHLARLQSLAPGAIQLRHRLRGARDKVAQFRDEEELARWQTLLTAKALRRDPAVQLAEPNFLLRPQAAPDDEAYPLQWHYEQINLPAAWDLTVGSSEVVVAVVDTGILAGHPDLRGQLLPGYDFISDPERAADGDGIDPDPEDVERDIGSGYHGTHVAGTVAAASNNRIGVAGIAWDTRIMPLRALSSEGGTNYDIGQAVRYAAGLPNDSGTLPPQRADIINLSLGGAGFSQFAQELYTEVHEAGVITVAAAGNEASSSPSYPAAYARVISVSAVDLGRTLTPYSNFGRTVDIAAPGGDGRRDANGDGYPDGVLSTGAVEGENGAIEYAYTFLVGTSMATPHVSGVLALMKAVNAALTPDDIDALLERGELGDDLGAPGRDDLYGHGLLNAQRAVAAALAASGNPPAIEPRLVASTRSLNFGTRINTLDLVLQNGGVGELQVIDVTSDQAWLGVAPLAVDGDGLGSYRVSVARDNLDPGTYRATVTATSSVNSVAVDALVSVGGGSANGDVGFLYVLLVDLLTGEPVAQVAGGLLNGRLGYRFADVAEGTYQIFAGSDADNDLLICDAGEACNAYLTLDDPVRVVLDRDLEGLDFSIDYLVSLPGLNALSGSRDPLPPLRRRE